MLIIALYAFYAAIALAVFFLTLETDRSAPAAEVPFISVVIAARNEERNNGACLRSLERQVFPREGFEIIVVNDHSTDRTSEIVEAAAKRLPGLREIRMEGEKAGKREALALGIRRARGEYVFQIDADCAARGRRLTALSSRLMTDCDVVGGFTLIGHGREIGASVQALEYLYLLSLNRAISRCARTLSLFGNNTAFKKAAYLRAGGYEDLRPGPVEDYDLVRAFHARGAGRTAFDFRGDSAVSTEPARRVRDYLSQRQRWAQAVLTAMGGWKLILIPLAVAHVGASVYPLFDAATVWLLGLRFGADLILILNPLRRFRECGLVPFWPFFTANLVPMPFVLGGRMALGKRIVWKGRVVGVPASDQSGRARKAERKSG
jgi:glycosyltransferase involved in cell wall biosynthesis